MSISNNILNFSTSVGIDQIFVSTGHFRWILWFTLGYATAAVCRDFTVTPLQAAIFQPSFFNLLGVFLVTRACLGIFLGSFRKTRWPPQPFLCWKMHFFMLLVLLSWRLKLFIIDMLDRYIPLLYVCQPLTLRLFIEGRSGGVKVTHKSVYVLGCVTWFIIGPRGLGC